MTKKRDIYYEERMQEGRRFYSFLLKLFVTGLIVGAAGLGYLWFWLARYEAQSPQGAINTYIEKVGDRAFDELYEESLLYFDEYNSREAVQALLMDNYGNRNSWGLSYAFSSMNGDNRIYTVYYESTQIGHLELTQPEDSSVWKVRTINHGSYYNIESLDDADFSINGVSIPENLSGHTVASPRAFEDLELDEKLDDMTQYSISEIIWYPVVETDDEHTAVVDHENRTVYVGPIASDEKYEEFTDEILATAKAYAEYITKDGTFANLNRHLYPYTTFYNNMVGFDNQWFSNHNSHQFENIEFFDVMPLGDNAFIGSISFDYIISSSTVTKTYSNSYQLTFVKNSQNLWKLTNLYLLESTEEEE